MNHRNKNHDVNAYFIVCGQTKGVPDEFKTREEIKADIKSTVNKKKQQQHMASFFFFLQPFVNHTTEALRILGEQRSTTNTVALQNHQASDWMMVEKGGVCHIFVEECYMSIPSNPAPDGTFVEVMSKIKKLKSKLRGSASKDVLRTG